METIENAQNQTNEMRINNEVKNYLIETAKWGKFLAIVGYVFLGIIVLVGLLFIVGVSWLNSFSANPARFAGVIYFIIALVYYFPINFLHKFSNSIRNGLESDSETMVTFGFQNLKSLFKFMGIITIIVLAIYVLFFLIAIVTGLAIASM
ncbi:DUF5362 family protein [Tenuifilum thalassicum]|uniref:DUF5362 domain-containing protein n=1 Tax=Tenuifilum thalassicum TaxID=2590900 RepID=A0A7D3XMD9_9BACT|nr:DUF5362 family protein [Tenuifilum thalassicum]QKG81055.1 hypothetical protein FHG85_12525 [Tenuifilum thalassicum]